MITNSITIYDYDNNPVVVNIPEKEIATIWIDIRSGDETGMIAFKDGTVFSFDASENRWMSYNDGGYCVEGENIQKWIEWRPKKSSPCYSYARQDEFGRFIE